MSVKNLTQKEYLKKYLSSSSDDKKKKKKKKSLKPTEDRFRIVDDDIDLKNMRPLGDDEIDIYNLAEDAPQIAGIIDERPEDLKRLEEFGTKRWKVVADENGIEDIKITAIARKHSAIKDSADACESDENSDTKLSSRNRTKGDKEILRSSGESNNVRKTKQEGEKSKKSVEKSDSDLSPARTPPTLKQKASPKFRRESDSDVSPPRKNKISDSFKKNRTKMNDGLSVSAFRKGQSSDMYNRSKKHHSDESPPRRIKESSSNLLPSSKSRKPDSDESPPRKERKYDSDESPPRKTRHQDSDESPPRKIRPRQGLNDPPPRRDKYLSNESFSKNVRQHSSDDSPNRKPRKKYLPTESPPRGPSKQQFSDESPSKKQRKQHTTDGSPYRKSRKEYMEESPFRKSRKKENDLYSPRQGRPDISENVSKTARRYLAESPHRNVKSHSSPSRTSKNQHITDEVSLKKQKKYYSSDSIENNELRRQEAANMLRMSGRKHAERSPVRKTSKWNEPNVASQKRSDLHIRDQSFDKIGSRHKETSSAERHKRRSISPKRRTEAVDSPQRNSRNFSPHERRKYDDESEVSPSRKRKESKPYSKRNTETDNHGLKGRRISDSDVGNGGKDSTLQSRSTTSHKNTKYNETREVQNRREFSDIRNNPVNDRSEERATTSKNRKERMLDGMKAGLQSKEELRKEILDYHQRETEMFSKLDPSALGEGVSAVLRDRKTGKRRNLEQEARDKEEREIAEAEHKSKYSRWGRGLKQVEDQSEKLKQDLYEMSKPLARYADDADLERHLRDQEREGDPMLEYIRSKRKETGTKEKPRYQGSYLPNRFSIPPGHRWDGVDRSNGYERKWFEERNARRAREEEAYKWSTSDM